MTPDDTIDTGEHATIRFEIGDRVIATQAIGLFRPRVPRGTAGVIAAKTPANEWEVHFDNGRVELVRASSLGRCEV